MQNVIKIYRGVQELLIVSLTANGRTQIKIIMQTQGSCNSLSTSQSSQKCSIAAEVKHVYQFISIHS